MSASSVGEDHGPSDEEIEALLQSLTLEEKVGQMAQVDIGNFIDPATDRVLDDYAVKGIVVSKVGSILNTYGGLPHSPQTWQAVQQTLDSYAKQTPHKIPLLYGIDSIHGANFVIGATLFPQQIGLAATFNVSHAIASSRISAYETRAASIPWTFSPVLDLGSDVRWPRLWEDFGEDPYLGSEMGVAMVRGFQGDDPHQIDAKHVAACGKHFLGYGSPVSGKDRTPAVIPENYLREYHLPAFKAAVDAGVATIMVNSALVNGVPVHCNRFLLTTLLKEELGFDGLVVTDWQDIENIHQRDRVARTSKEAIRLAINAGIDMSMIPVDLQFCVWLAELVTEGAVPLARIDDAVRRILRVKARLGLFRTATTSAADYPDFGSPTFEKAAYDAAAESITLLKNDGNILPLAVGTRVLVAGPNAHSMRALNGGWSYSWQGHAVPQFTAQYRTILQAIQAVNADATGYAQGVAYLETGKYWEEREVDITAAVTAVRDVDCIILAVGENSYCEKRGDLRDLSLSALQLKLAEALIETGKPVVLVLSEGRPRIIERIVDRVRAVLQIYLPGNFGGDAVADVLFGVVNPSGRLPYSYPRYPHSLINYWHKYSEEQPDDLPLWEFGHGLSYTTFAYSDLTLSKSVIKPADTLTVKVTVANKGALRGKEAVLLFVSDLWASTAPDTKRLRRFTKIELEPGEAQVVTFELTVADLSFVNIENKFVAEPGEFTIAVATEHANFLLEE
jgi:beta-glucosidase